MIISTVIICHNQDHIVNINIAWLKQQSIKPNNIIVVDDRSDLFNIKSDMINEPFIYTLSTLFLDYGGRSAARNLGIKKALELNSDYIIFMDGDTIPSDIYLVDNYISRFESLNEKNRIIFGLRHNVNQIKYKNFIIESPQIGQQISEAAWTEKDPRLTHGLCKIFNELTSFNEKVNFILTGWITWSCNFCTTSDVLKKIYDHNMQIYGKSFWFDDSTFKTWGFEDNAFGLDALYAGIDIKLDENIITQHLIHKSEYTQLKHIQYSSLLFNRFRMQEEYKRNQKLGTRFE